ncbi:hypothetical protein BST61_g11600 [Cercospora zeina]
MGSPAAYHTYVGLPKFPPLPAHHSSCSGSDNDEVQKSAGKILATPEYATLPHALAITDDLLLCEMLDWDRQRVDPKPVILYYLSMDVPTRLECDLCTTGQVLGGTFAAESIKIDVRMIATVDCEERQIKVTDRVIAQFPDEVFRIAACRGEEVIGACVLNLRTGVKGIGGLFDMEVNADHRRKGTGTALTTRAIQLAEAKGARYIYLNSTPEARNVYRKSGFESVGGGDGWSWHLPVTFAGAKKPSRGQVDFVQAVMLGNITQLGWMATGGMINLEDMQGKTANGLTAVELAVLSNEPESVRWMIEDGVNPDVVSLWGLGWRNETVSLIQQQPHVVNRKAGRSGATPLHVAVERCDEELAVTVLRCTAIDLGVRGDMFGSTAVEWASFLGRTRMLRLFGSNPPESL